MAGQSSNDADSLQVRLLGEFQISCGGRVVDDSQWRLTKSRSLVKLLALSPAHSLHREQALDLLWPELEPDAAANNLHQALFAARRTLESVIPGIRGTEIIQFQRQALLLQPPGSLWVDVDAFEQLAASAQQAHDVDSYYAAIDLYAGDLLPEDRYEDWAGERRELLRDRYLGLLQRLAQLLESREQYQPAIDVLRRLLTAEPAAEQAHVGLMRLYALTDRQQQALRQYARLREILEREFDAEPDPDTDRLYRAILDRRFPPAAARQPAPAPQVPVAPPAPAAVARPASDFVNRVREIEALHTAIDAACAGQGQVVLLAGQPGIGKTRTASESVHYAQEHGMTVLWGRCSESEGAPAWWPWTQIIRSWVGEHDAETTARIMGAGAADIARIVPEVREQLPHLPEPAPLEPEQERFRLFDSVARFLEQVSRQQPLLLVLDDLHWADRSTLLLLEFLTDTIAELPLCLIGAYRDAEVDRHHPLSRTLARLSRGATTRRIALAGLAVEDVARYSQVAAGVAPPRGLVNAIWEQTEGNPFYLSEVVRLLVEEGRLEQPEEVRHWRLAIPPSVRETVGLRLDRLSQAASQVLTIAAVAGREFRLPVLERVCDLAPARVLEVLEEALHARVLDELPDEPGVFRFAHILIRQTLYEEVSNTRRVRLHGQIGEALEDVYRANLEPYLTDLSYHFYLAAPLGDASRAIEYAVLAGAQAMDRVAYADAVGHYERALQLLEDRQPHATLRQCEVLLLLGEAQKDAGDALEARATYQRAADIARLVDAPELFARAALGFVAAGLYSEVTDETGVQMLEEALRLIGPDDSVLRAMLLSRLASALSNASDAVKRRPEVSEAALEVARRVGDAAAIASALTTRLEDLWRAASPRERLAEADEAQRLAEAAGSTALGLAAQVARIFYLLELGDIDQVDVEIRQFADRAVELRQPQLQWSAMNRRTMRLLMQGEFDAAEQLAHEALEIGRRPARGAAPFIFFVHLFLIRREQGRLSELEAIAQNMVEQMPETPLFRVLLALLFVETDRVESARNLYRSLSGENFLDLPLNILWTMTIALLADLSVELCEVESAPRLYELLHPYGERNIIGSNSFYLGPASHYLGSLAALMGRHAEAAQHFEHASAMSARMAARPFHARTSFAHASLLLNGSSDQQARARNLLQSASEVAQRLGMVRLHGRCRTIMEGDGA